MQLPPMMSDAKLTSLAVSSRAFAKALRYKENEFRRFFNTSSIYSGVVLSCPDPHLHDLLLLFCVSRSPSLHFPLTRFP